MIPGFCKMHLLMQSKQAQKLSNRLIALHKQGSTPSGKCQIREISKRDMQLLLKFDFSIELELLNSIQRSELYKTMRAILLDFPSYANTSAQDMWQYISLSLMQHVVSNKQIYDSRQPTTDQHSSDDDGGRYQSTEKPSEAPAIPAEQQSVTSVAAHELNSQSSDMPATTPNTVFKTPFAIVKPSQRTAKSPGDPPCPPVTNKKVNRASTPIVPPKRRQSICVVTSQHEIKQNLHRVPTPIVPQKRRQSICVVNAAKPSKIKLSPSPETIECPNRKTSKTITKRRQSVCAPMSHNQRFIPPPERENDENHFDYELTPDNPTLTLNAPYEHIYSLQMDLLNANTIRFALNKSQPRFENNVFNLHDLLYWPGLSVGVRLGEVSITRSFVPNFEREITIGLHDMRNAAKRPNPLEIRRYGSDDTLPVISKNILDVFLRKLGVMSSGRWNTTKLCLRTILHDIKLVQTLTLRQTYSYFMSAFPYGRYFENSAIPKRSTRHSTGHNLYQVRMFETINPEIRFVVNSCPFVTHKNEKQWIGNLELFLNRMFSDNEKLNVTDEYHTMMKNSLQFECTLCAVRFDGDHCVRDVIAHLRLMHNQPNEWSCIHCGWSANTEKLAVDKWIHQCV